MQRYKIVIIKLVILLNVMAVACTNNQSAGIASDSTRAAINPATLPPNAVSTNQDTLLVYRKAAVFYEPDNAQIAKRRSAVGENDFYAGVEDYAYYLNAAHDYLDSTRLTLLDAKNRKFIKFFSGNVPAQTIKLDTLPDLWGIYFFEPSKKAKQVEMTEIEEEYKSYFK